MSGVGAGVEATPVEGTGGDLAGKVDLAVWTLKGGNGGGEIALPDICVVGKGEVAVLLLLP